MKKWLFLFFIFLFSELNAQVIGKIFDKNYADKEFGSVLKYVEINNESLFTLLEKAGEYIMFNIDDGTVRALNKNRISVIGSATSEDEVFYNMSTSQVKKLLEQGTETITKIERRPNTLTLTNGNFTLELVQPCPPICL